MSDIERRVRTDEEPLASCIDRPANSAPSSNELLFANVSGLLWSAAFALFTIRYSPVWLSPRVDGKPG